VNEKKMGTKDDPGGYYRKFFLCDPYSNTPNNFLECRAMAYHHWTLTGVNGPEKPPNCSSIHDVKIKQGDVAGVINGKTVCSKNDCCKAFWGVPTERTNFDRLHGLWTDQSKAGLCPTMPEPAYCSWVLTTLWKCLEYIPEQGKNDRNHIRPCADNNFAYLMSCPIMKSTNLMLENLGKFKFDPDNYLEKLSIKEGLVYWPIMFGPDRVCNSYAYYNPDAKDPTSAGVNFAAVGTWFVLASFSLM